MGGKIPRSVLVVIHTTDLEVLLLERVDAPGFWQSVTGSCDSWDEPLAETAKREVLEETGLDCRDYRLTDWRQDNEYEIYERWRHRYPPGVTRNREHVFGLHLPKVLPIRLSPREHSRYEWLPWEMAANRCFSATNREAIFNLPRRVG